MALCLKSLLGITKQIWLICFNFIVILFIFCRSISWELDFISWFIELLYNHFTIVYLLMPLISLLYFIFIHRLEVKQIFLFEKNTGKEILLMLYHSHKATIFFHDWIFYVTVAQFDDFYWHLMISSSICKLDITVTHCITLMECLNMHFACLLSIYRCIISHCVSLRCITSDSTTAIEYEIIICSTQTTLAIQ